MITKYNEFVNESLRDKMVGKSGNDIIDILVNRINKDVVTNSQLQNYKNCIKYLLDNNYVYDYTDDFGLLWFNWKGYDSIYIHMNITTKFDELKDNVQSNKDRYHLKESLRDKMTPKSGEELRMAYEKEIRKHFNIPTKELEKKIECLFYFLDNGFEFEFINEFDVIWFEDIISGYHLSIDKNSDLETVKKDVNWVKEKLH